VTGLLTLGESLGLVATGPLQHATVATVGIGGAESNVAIGVRRLGGSATWLGRVGADPWGDRVLRELRAEDLTVVAVTDPSAPTALMTKERRTPLSTTVTYHRHDSAGSRLTPSDVPATLVESARLVHLTGITPGLSTGALATVRSVLDRAAAAGVPVSFDVNHRSGVWLSRDAAAVYREVAARSAVVFAGEDEARLLTGTTTTDPVALLAELVAATSGDAVLKRGADGCLARVSGELLRVPALVVPVVDTVGAGDAFVAGYLAETLAVRDPATRLATAVRCGAFACLSPGDWEGLPTRDDLAGLDVREEVRR
jgi:2-dehydro-3-deoxygluconokinase